jgi:hypothetical protein
MKYLQKLPKAHENFAKRFRAVRTMKVILVNMRQSETFNAAVLATAGYSDVFVRSCILLKLNNHINYRRTLFTLY